MKEQKTITFTRYRDDDGNPTCATDFMKNDVCEFYRTELFGTHETCLFAPTHEKHPMHLCRKGKDGLGLLIPGDWCPLFKRDTEEQI